MSGLTFEIKIIKKIFFYSQVLKIGTLTIVAYTKWKNIVNATNETPINLRNISQANKNIPVLTNKMIEKLEWLSTWI